MKPYLFASGNRGKCKEVKQMAELAGVPLVAAFDLTPTFCAEHGLSVPQGAPPEVEEAGATYEENAFLKAQAYHRWSGLTAIGDDSGLEVKALDGGPGLYTARFAGENATDEENLQKLLTELSGESERSAFYVCVLATCDGTNDSLSVRGELHGEIARQKTGQGGFGYDPIFFLPEQKKSLAEAKQAGVAVETHRIQALKKLLSELAA